MFNHDGYLPEFVTITEGKTSDQTIRLTNIQTANKCPNQLRRVGYRDIDTGKHYVFLTNNFKLTAGTISDIYKARWQVELLFKWIKQNLKIKSFIGTSKNAVMTQIWIALCVLASSFHQISVKDEQNHAADLAVTTAQFI